jgi:tetratricopeptide (TPR) repeat protein
MAINAMLRGDFDTAAAGFRRTIEINPDWVWGYIKLARTLSMQKKCPEAFAQAEIGERIIAGGAAPLSRSWLGITYATCGDTVRARQKLAELHALEKSQYVDPVTFAAIHSALGEMDQALTWYEKAYQDRTPNMSYALIFPLVSPELAGNARFQAILDHMGLKKP